MVHFLGDDLSTRKFVFRLMIFTYKSISGSWTAQADLTSEATRTFYSQNAFDMPLGSNAIYMGDRWRASLLGSSRYLSSFSVICGLVHFP